MAFTPQNVRPANLTKRAATTLSKANTLSNELTKPVMNKVKVSEAQNSIQQFAKNNDLKQNNLRKRAPRRVSQDDLATTWLASNIEYVNVDGEWTPMYYGGGTTTWSLDTFVEEANVAVYNINNYFQLADPDGDADAYDWGYSFPIYLEVYLNNEVGAIFSGEQAYYFVNEVEEDNGSFWTTDYIDTYWYPIIVDEAYYTGASDTIADIALLMGIDDSGVLYTSQKYGVMHAYVQYKVTTDFWGTIQSETLVDSTVVKAGLFGSNYFLLPNAIHEYTVAKQTENETASGNTIYQLGNTYQDAVFAYQNETNETVYLWNMWGLGYRNIEMNLDADGLLTFPLQPVHEENVDDANEYYAANGFVFSESFYNFPVEYDFDADTIAATGWYATPVELNETRDKIVWGGNQILDYFEVPNDPDYADYMFMGIGYIPFLNNSITLAMPLTLPEPAETWQLGDVNHDHEIDVADVTALIAWILGNDAGEFYVEQANVDQDAEGGIDVGDVTALIAIILAN